MGGWVIPAMLVQASIFDLVKIPVVYAPTLLLWLIPAIITAVHWFWKTEREK